MKRILFAAITLSIGLLPSLAQVRVTGVEKLTPYAGTWKTQTEKFNTNFSKAGKDAATLRNDCWKTDAFFACHQFVDEKPSALIVYRYDEKADAYDSYVIPPDGGAPSKGTLLVKDNVWTFPWEDKDDAGKKLYFRVVNVWKGTDLIEFRMEYSNDQANWTVESTGIERKTK